MLLEVAQKVDLDHIYINITFGTYNQVSTTRIHLEANMLDTNTRIVEEMESAGTDDTAIVFELGGVGDTKGGPGSQGDGNGGLWNPE